MNVGLRALTLDVVVGSFSMREDLRGLWLCWALPLIITFLVMLIVHKTFKPEFVILNIVAFTTYITATIDGIFRLE
jgi:hypothetical protein